MLVCMDKLTETDSILDCRIMSLLDTINREGKPGTALMALVLTHEKIDQSGQHHGGYRTFDSTQQVPYSTFQLSAPKNGVHNCIVVHEPSLILILGKVVAM